MTSLHLAMWVNDFVDMLLAPFIDFLVALYQRILNIPQMNYWNYHTPEFSSDYNLRIYEVYTWRYPILGQNSMSLYS